MSDVYAVARELAAGGAELLVAAARDHYLAIAVAVYVAGALIAGFDGKCRDAGHAATWCLVSAMWPLFAAGVAILGALGIAYLVLWWTPYMLGRHAGGWSNRGGW